MSLVKCGNGYGYGHGHSKPQMNYHRQNSEHVTTVVTEINRMTVNEKPCYGGGAVQKHAFREEVYQQGADGGYARHHGGVTDGVHRYQAAHGGNACKKEFAGGHHAGGGRIHHYKEYESEESEDESGCEESEDESDCEEGFARGRHGGVHRYEAYKREEKRAGSDHGGVHHYAAYEHREEHGGGGHYESYENTTTEGYSGGYGQRKNRCVV